MQGETKDNEANYALAQFQYALSDSFMKTIIDKNWILDIIKDLNCKISATKYLQINQKELIGDTALHLAATNRNLKAFKILIDLGADFTIQNNNSMTALHKLIEQKETLILEKCTLDDPFIRSILSAHLKHKNFENPSNNSELSHFHVACASNNVELVQGFLRSGVVINKAVKANSSLFPGFTPLHFAAKYSALKVVEVLLLHGADIHAKDNKGMVPMHVALEGRLKIMGQVDLDKSVRNNNEKILQLLLAKENKEEMIVLDNWGLSHLHVACTLKDSKVADCLLNKVADINQPVSMDSPLWPGYTALHFAVLCNIDTVKLLMKKEADISIKDAKGVTPYDIFVEKCKPEDIYEILSLNSSWKNYVLEDYRTKLIDLFLAMREPNQLAVFLENFCDYFNSQPWPGYTQMHLDLELFSLAVEVCTEESDISEDPEEFLRYLCKQICIMLYSRDVHDYTPFHLAFRLNKKIILNLLFDFMEFDHWVHYIDNKGLTLLHMACAQNKTDALKRVLALGGNVNTVYRGKSSISPLIYSGSIALHVAVANGSVEAVKILMEEGVDIYAKDANDMTPIHLLLLNSDASILLLSPDLRNSVTSRTELSHLHVACLLDKPETVERLLDDGANINSIITYPDNANMDLIQFLQKYAGYSPLMMAYKHENYNVVELLLQRGADIFVSDTKGKPLVCSIFGDEPDSRLDGFVKVLKENENLQARLKTKTGMSKLHLACILNNKEMIEKLLSEGANVNEQIRFESPILQGYTPLHILVYMSKAQDVEKSMVLLIGKGADVTLANAASDTAVHLAYDMLHTDEVRMHLYANMLLEAQRDFSVNPANIGAITHFHIACRVFNASVVEEFLKYAEIDINQPIDFFHAFDPGYTALHVVAMSDVRDFNEMLKQLGTVDLLLKYGASVHIEDVYGDTPLQNCFRPNTSSNSLDLFERMARAGADVNTRNLDGNSPLHYYLDSHAVTPDGIKTLLRMGCRLNTFNALTNHGCVGKIPPTLMNDELSLLIFFLSVNFAKEIMADESGRTMIHNLVSDDDAEPLAKEYFIVIDQLSHTCDIDDQDNLGRTALHLAAKFYNAEAISGLLMAGADIDIRDNDGKIALAYGFDSCTCEDDLSASDDDQCEHFQTLETLAIHVQKLRLCGVDVNELNADLAYKAFEKFQRKNAVSENFLKELEAVKNTIVEGHQPLTLFDFLPEIGVVARYPRMSSLQRKTVDKFFWSNRGESLVDKFPELAGILQLQYRKARARPHLMEMARDSLTVLVGFQMPEICSDCILILLTNSELKSLMASTV